MQKEANMPLPESRWLRVKQAAEYLQLHQRSVYKACILKRIPHVKLPGIGIRIDKKKLDRMLERTARSSIKKSG
jgi:excisionase family DNA binding protein